MHQLLKRCNINIAVNDLIFVFLPPCDSKTALQAGRIFDFLVVLPFVKELICVRLYIIHHQVLLLLLLHRSLCRIIAFNLRYSTILHVFSMQHFLNLSPVLQPLHRVIV